MRARGRASIVPFFLSFFSYDNSIAQIVLSTYIHTYLFIVFIRFFFTEVGGVLYVLYCSGGKHILFLALAQSFFLFFCLGSHSNTLDLWFGSIVFVVLDRILKLKRY